MRKLLAIAAIASTCVLATEASAQILRSSDGQLTGIVVRHTGNPDYANAQEMPLPRSTVAPPSLVQGLLAAESANPRGAPGYVPGAAGTGKLNPVRLFTPSQQSSSGEPSPEGFGTSNHVFTTARVDASGANVQQYYPFRPAGKLFFKDGTKNFVCSASLVSKGLVVTAAHCVAAFGQSRFLTNHQFVPAYRSGVAPYGTWTAFQIWIKTSYYNGTDSCAVAGVVCQNDVAIIILNPQSNVYAGTNTGYYGTGWGGYGFNPSNQALINQLGYPVALDGGNLMLRNDSQGFLSTANSSNTVIGSLMTGGSSGGPWLVNLGVAPALGCDSKGCTIAPTEGQANTVVGVTSWGYNPTSPPTTKTYKVMQQGASRFVATNICSLMKSACTSRPLACHFTAASLAC